MPRPAPTPSQEEADANALAFMRTVFNGTEIDLAIYDTIKSRHVAFNPETKLFTLTELGSAHIEGKL